MKATFTRGEENKLGIRFEPETFEEQLLLEIFTKASVPGHDFLFSGWESNHPGRQMREGLTSVWGQITERKTAPSTAAPSTEVLDKLTTDSEFLDRLMTELEEVLPGDGVGSNVNGIVAAIQHWKDIAGASLKSHNEMRSELKLAEENIARYKHALETVRKDRDELRAVLKERDKETILRAAADMERASDLKAALGAHAIMRTYCDNCGIALDVGGGCGKCKPRKAPTMMDVVKDRIAENRQEHDDRTRGWSEHHDLDDTLERINCPRAGQLMHHGCGWCAEHNRPSFECLCNGARAAVRPSDLPVPRCENPGCREAPVHGEHWHDKLRWWCERHVPMSGHYEHCGHSGASCAPLVKGVTRPDLFSDLARRHKHLAFL